MKSKKGFTLIELVLVISIVALLLMAIGLTSGVKELISLGKIQAITRGFTLPLISLINSSALLVSLTTASTISRTFFSITSSCSKLNLVC